MTQKVSDAFPSKYLRAADIDGVINVTIKDVDTAELGPEKEKKPIVNFKELSKPLVLNKTNAETIAHFLKIDDMDKWSGEKIALTTAPVNFQGKLVDSIRVMKPIPPLKEALNDSIPF